MIKKTVLDLNRKTIESYKDTLKIPTVVVLDNVRSLNNVGSVFRICDAFLIKKLYLCGITGKPPHKEIYRSALGAELSVKWEYVDSCKECINFLLEQDYKIISVEQTHNSVCLKKFDFDISQKYAIIFGNEVNGISEDVLRLSNIVLEIPQSGTKHSLNISTCSGIVLWEVYKKFI